METRSVWVRRQLREKMNSHKKFEGKPKKILKTAFTMQNTRFSRLKWVANKTPSQAAKTFKDKILKNFLSVFHDWKVYPQGSRELSRENLCVTFATGSPLANKLPKLTRELATVACDLTYPRLSRQNRAKMIFEIFSFLRTKYFPKTPKTLKNLFVLESTKIEYVKTHFIKYNHTNEYGIYWT